MIEVGAIRDRDKVNELKRQARKLGEQQYLLVLIGLNSGLRIGDILRLKASDFRESDELCLKEQKTGKKTYIEMHPAVLLEIRKMISKKADDELLFPSPQLKRRKEAISYKTAYSWVNKAARAAGIKGAVGCHTLRKTYGYHFYQDKRDVALLMEHFNHSDQGVTLRYIGIVREYKNKKTRDFKI